MMKFRSRLQSGWKALRAVFAGLLVLLSNPALASDQSGQVTQILTMDNGTVLFFLNGPRTGTIPSCAVGHANRFALNGKTPEGQVRAANLLTAFSMRTTVYVYGKNSCVSWADTEEVEYFNNVAP